MTMTDRTSRFSQRSLEIVPLADRLRWMLAVRLCLVLGSVAAWWVDRGSPAIPANWLLVPGLLLLTVSLLLHPLSSRHRRLARMAITVPVLVDALYLAWALYLTGGLPGPVVHLIVLHVVAVTLLVSFRTGLKLAFWHSLVVMAVLEAVTTGLLPPLDGVDGFDDRRYAVFLASVWLTTLATASLAAVNERELRRRRYDEAALRRLGVALHEARTDRDVVACLLEFVTDAADAPLTAVSWWLAVDESSATTQTARLRAGEQTQLLDGVDAAGPGSLLREALTQRRTTLAAMRGPDAWVDTVLDSAARVVVVPFVMEGEVSGACAFTHSARAGSRLEHRRVGIVEQAVAHAATALTRAALLERLQRSALTDGLTGVSNRRAFDATLDQEVASASRAGSPLAVLLLDLDHFKSFNDNFGHAAGDDVLRAAGAALRGCMRSGDHVARYGGEEFAVVLPGATRADAAAAASRVLAALRRVSGPRAVTASVGVSCLPQHGWTGGELLAAADEALYAAKAGGRDQARFAGEDLPLPEPEVPDASVCASAGSGPGTGGELLPAASTAS